MAKKPAAVQNSPQGEFIAELKTRSVAAPRKTFEWRDALAVARTDKAFPSMNLAATPQKQSERPQVAPEKLQTTAKGNLDLAAIRGEVATQISDQHIKRQKMREKIIAK